MLHFKSPYTERVRHYPTAESPLPLLPDSSILTDITKYVYHQQVSNLNEAGNNCFIFYSTVYKKDYLMVKINLKLNVEIGSELLRFRQSF